MDATEKFLADLKQKWVSGRGNALFVKTNELDFAAKAVISAFRFDYGKDIYVWKRYSGLVSPYGRRIIPNTFDFGGALTYANNLREKSLVIFYNAGEEINIAMRSTSTATIDVLRELLQTCRLTGMGSSVQPVFTGPSFIVPPELEEYFSLVEVPLPNYRENEELLDEAMRNITEITGKDYSFDVPPALKIALINASLGLTRLEAEVALKQAVAFKSFTQDDVNIISKLKTEKYGNKALEHYDNVLNLDDVGGLENLKHWLVKRTPLWESDEAVTHIPRPKGILLTGLPGTGKSLSAKAVASAFGFPLIRLDIGAVFGKYYGESERGMKEALKAVEANAPCVLWIDEIEKGLGVTTDSGGQTREAVAGALLTWMQEHKYDIFIVATANNATSLRPEMLRKGRFDEIFFVDLPTAAEREAIFKIHLKKRVPEFVGDLENLVKASEGYVGAEIEQAIISALIELFGSEKVVTEDYILAALSSTPPLAISRRDVLETTRRWARDAKVVSASIDGVQLPRAGFGV
jgi:AAA+ superfamily predicted ATPase